MPATPDQYADFTLTYVAGGAGGLGTPLLAADTSLVLPSGLGARYPSTAPFYALLGQQAYGLGEVVQVGAVSGDTLSSLTRGVSGSAQQWAVGTAVQQTLPKAGLDNLWTQVRYLVYNAKAYGAKGDNATNDTTAVQNAINAANTAAGGVVFFPRGTYLVNGLTLYSSVHLRGEGMGVSILKLTTNANTDLINGGNTNLSLINVTDQSIGTGNTGGLAFWGLHDLTLDGAKGVQSGGTSYCLNVYGYGYTIENVSCRNGYTGGVQLDWNGGSNSPAGSDSMIAHVSNLRIHDSNGIGLAWGGPHDTQIVNSNVYLSGTHDLYVGPHAGGTHFTNCHFWSPEQSGATTGVVVLCEGQALFSNCQIEGSDLCQLVLNCSGTAVVGGAIYSAGNNGAGIQLGQQAGDTPFTGSSYQSAGLATAVSAQKNLLTTIVHDVNHANGAIRFRNDGGANMLRVALYSSTSGVAFTGSMNANDVVEWVSTGMTAGQANATFQQMGGDFALRQSSSAATTGNSGTITAATTGVARVNPSGDVTGIIVGVGAFAGQILAIVNESAFTLTMAASGTSHVANGTSCVIAATTSKLFVWDSGTSLWYSVGG